MSAYLLEIDLFEEYNILIYLLNVLLIQNIKGLWKLDKNVTPYQGNSLS